MEPCSDPRASRILGICAKGRSVSLRSAGKGWRPCGRMGLSGVADAEGQVLLLASHQDFQALFAVFCRKLVMVCGCNRCFVR